MQELIVRAKELLENGTVARVLGWKKGEHNYDPEVAFFNDAKSLESFVYNGFCGANLSKYMIEASKMEGKTLVFLKPCDSYSFQQLMKEHRVDREKAYIIGVGCWGKLDTRKLGTEGILDVEIQGDVLKVSSLYGDETVSYKDAMLERCHVCKGKEHRVFDEKLLESADTVDADRFAEVEKNRGYEPRREVCLLPG